MNHNHIKTLDYQSLINSIRIKNNELERQGEREKPLRKMLRIGF